MNKLKFYVKHKLLMSRKHQSRAKEFNLLFFCSFVLKVTMNMLHFNGLCSYMGVKYYQFLFINK